jgi:hypothetical protein
MRLKKRKMIKRIISYILAILLFLIVAPTIIFWALGYRLDLKNKTISQTGFLAFQTNQSSFNIWIGDKKYASSKDEIIIKNLLPKNYSVKIEKEGYYPWQENMSVEPQKITRQENIILFPKKSNPEELTNDVSNYSLTKDNLTIITLNQNKNNLKRINVGNKNITDSMELENIDSFQPNSTGSKVLVRQKEPENRMAVINFDQKNDNINELSKEPDKFNRVLWLPRNDQTLFLIYNDSLYSTNTNNEKMSFNLLKADVINFEFSNDQIFYIQKNNNNLSLYQSDFALENPKQLVENLPSASYEIIPSHNSTKVILKNLDNQIIFIVKDKKLEELDKDVKNLQWSADSQKIVYCNLFEIWQIDFSKELIDKSFINRYSDEIKNLSWYSDNHHIIFTLDNKINVIEEKGTNLVELLSFRVDKQTISVFDDHAKTNIIFLNQKKSNKDSIALFNLSFNRFD